jgi:hypothetical protein
VYAALPKKLVVSRARSIVARLRASVFGGGGRSLILNFEAMESDGRGETDGSDVGSFNARVRYDVCIVWFFGGVVVINLSPLVCCVREIATLLKSL